MNEVRLDGVLVERAAVRHTPAGVPVVEGRICHRSDVFEAGAPRKLEFVVSAIALGAIARKLEREALGEALDCAGFLAPRSRRSSKLVLHLTEYRRTRS